MLIIYNPITGRELEVSYKDLPDKLNWNEANEVCKALGNGWRLPTIEEFKEIYDKLYENSVGYFKLSENSLYEDSRGNFKRDDFYWSSTVGKNRYIWNAKPVLYFDFGGARIYYSSKRVTYYVRLVRDL